jgi:hypothetical protein
MQQLLMCSKKMTLPGRHRNLIWGQQLRELRVQPFNRVGASKTRARCLERLVVLSLPLSMPTAVAAFLLVGRPSTGCPSGRMSPVGFIHL